ncbi:MAG: hypothetical protein M0R77_13025 [Gammaproteobacteria bacterium]|nr:hypothetical protein [Gammaproteobacteria bacterium]
MAKVYYTYILSDQGTPFYVGYGTGDRMYSHEKFARGDKDLGYGLGEDYNPRKTRKIKKLLKEGRSVEYSYTEFESKEQALNFEMELISQYGRKGIDKNGTLMNITSGGTGGNTIGDHPECDKIIQKRSDSVRATYNDPVKGQAVRDKIKATKLLNGTWAQPLSGSKLEQTRALCRKNAQSQRMRVYQCDLSGEVIKEWESMKQAAQTLGIGQGAISNAINKKTKSGHPLKAGGFRWIMR